MKDENIASKADIKPVHLHDYEKQRVLEIRFEALVKGYDFGYRDRDSGGFIGLKEIETKPLPPQWFKLEFKFTLEGIKGATDSELGKTLKSRLYELEAFIDKHYKK